MISLGTNENSFVRLMRRNMTFMLENQVTLKILLIFLHTNLILSYIQICTAHYSIQSLNFKSSKSEFWRSKTKFLRKCSEEFTPRKENHLHMIWNDEQLKGESLRTISVIWYSKENRLQMLRKRTNLPLTFRLLFTCGVFPS